MTGSSDGRAELVAALIAIEDQFAWVDLGSLQDAVDLEASANALGEEELAVRARICQAKMWMRMGEVAATARRVREIQHWGVVHGSAMVQARAHLLWANVHRHLGDLAAALEHSLLAVELLDDTATPSTQIWHRAKLADALGQVNSMDEARLHYRQSEDLATTHQLARLRMAVLNNWAYMELTCGFAEAAHQVAERLQAVAAANGFELDGADLDTIANIQVANRAVHRGRADHRAGHRPRRGQRRRGGGLPRRIPAHPDGGPARSGTPTGASSRPRPGRPERQPHLDERRRIVRCA
jgi:hypothetical protein